MIFRECFCPNPIFFLTTIYRTRRLGIYLLRTGKKNTCKPSVQPSPPICSTWTVHPSNGSSIRGSSSAFPTTTHTLWPVLLGRRDDGARREESYPRARGNSRARVGHLPPLHHRRCCGPLACSCSQPSMADAYRTGTTGFDIGRSRLARA